eukprot:Plantae.Rhodophyta-Purpureofilum_apyrenoidigerum.ctg5783.p1 GENE.Plantae.Rhodophyta-Purpureofilum_apyrenoidigerum.ctg5783~~Plantae.Rhodophyta-Purpureofilum_apyrenoidigerum.ctg5783.p1  ORF type:complete len:441 (+),score=75.96 Plantae.Rhodophyta-Purpureofilum_apyrenoidigerum.ctg5783:202-1524(+)
MAARGKRRRATTARAKEAEPAANNDEIESDESEADGVPRKASHTASSSETESEDDEAETAEEKRLRLAKKYLADMGVNEDDDDDAEEILTAAKRDVGMTEAQIAEGIRDSHVAVASNRKSHRCSPSTIDIIPSSTLAVSGGKDHKINAWDVETAKAITSYSGGNLHQKNGSVDGHTKEVLGIVVSDDGQLVASASGDRTIRVWDLRAQKCVHVFRGHRAAVTSLALRKGSRQLFSASYDRTVKVFDLGEMTYVETLYGHGAEVVSVDALNRERATSCGMDGTIRLWKIVEGSQLVFKCPTALSVDSVAMITDTSFLSCNSNNTISLWGAHKNKPMYTIAGAHSHEPPQIVSVAACTHSDLCASGGQDGSLKLYKIAGSRAQRSLEFLRDVKIDGFINGLKFDSCGRILAVAAGQEHRLGRWSKASSWKANAVHFISFSDN